MSFSNKAGRRPAAGLLPAWPPVRAFRPRRPDRRVADHFAHRSKHCHCLRCILHSLSERRGIWQRACRDRPIRRIPQFPFRFQGFSAYEKGRTARSGAAGRANPSQGGVRFWMPHGRRPPRTDNDRTRKESAQGVGSHGVRRDRRRQADGKGQRHGACVRDRRRWRVLAEGGFMPGTVEIIHALVAPVRPLRRVAGLGNPGAVGQPPAAPLRAVRIPAPGTGDRTPRSRRGTPRLARAVQPGLGRPPAPGAHRNRRLRPRVLGAFPPRPVRPGQLTIEDTRPRLHGCPKPAGLSTPAPGATAGISSCEGEAAAGSRARSTHSPTPARSTKFGKSNGARSGAPKRMLSHMRGDEPCRSAATWKENPIKPTAACTSIMAPHNHR